MGHAGGVAFEYLPVDRSQQYLLPPDMGEWLPADHLVWFVLDVVSRLDTSSLHARHRNDGVGRRSYNPDMLLCLLIYAYCTGLRSSRQIERRCESDVAFRVVCANLVPDHTTISRFRQAHNDQAQQLFVDVLVMCFEAGLGAVGVVAVDGTKMGCDASLGSNRTRESIEVEIAAMFVDADGVDGEENRLFGDSNRGDEIEEELTDPYTRKERLDAAFQVLLQQEAARKAERAAAAAAWKHSQEEATKRGGRPKGKPPEGQEVASAEAAVRAEGDLAAKKRSERAAKEQKLGHKIRGHQPGPVSRGQRLAGERLIRAKEMAEKRARKHSTTNPPAKASANTTDPQSRMMKTQQGWVQGYNAQAAVNERGIVIAAEVSQETSDFRQCQPMIAAISKSLKSVGCERDNVDLILFDAGYISNENLLVPGPDRLIATGKARTMKEEPKTTGNPPPGSTPIQAMNHRLRTPAGRSTYKLRGQLVEPYFGNIKDGRGFRRFTRRGLKNANAEWKLIAATNNILKMFTTQPKPAT